MQPKSGEFGATVGRTKFRGYVSNHSVSKSLEAITKNNAISGVYDMTHISRSTTVLIQMARDESDYIARDEMLDNHWMDI